jgi:hypothetical protein
MRDDTLKTKKIKLLRHHHHLKRLPFIDLFLFSSLLLSLQEKTKKRRQQQQEWTAESEKRKKHQECRKIGREARYDNELLKVRTFFARE